jgi:uncharacterized protein
MNRHYVTFSPLFGLKSGHVQTIMAGLAHLTNRIEPPHSKSVLFDIGNNDKLSCEVSIPPEWHEEAKSVVLIHGLGGSHNSSYMIRLSKKLYCQGIKVVRYNLRNCGSGAGLSHLPYHAGNSPDLLATLEQLKKAHPLSPITVAGFSLGGNILLKLLGELGESSLIEKAIAISPPFDLSYTSRALSKGFNRLYERYYLHFLRQQSAAFVHERLHTLFEYDDLITARLWGFTGAEDYYAKCSNQCLLSQIKTPCNLLFSADDPFVNYRRLTADTNPHMEVWISSYGGHMGFFASPTAEQDSFWMDQVVLKWIL